MQASASLSARSLLSPHDPVLVGTSRFYKAGRLALPSEDAGLGCWGATAATGPTPRMQLQRWAPGPHRDSCSRHATGLAAGPSQPLLCSAGQASSLQTSEHPSRPQGSAWEPRGGGAGGLRFRVGGRVDGVALAAPEGRAGVRLAELRSLRSSFLHVL